MLSIEMVKVNKMSIVSSSRTFLKENFHALTHKNFRYYWFGQCVSLIGTWAQNIGQSWLVLSLTDSPLLLGLVTTIQFLPVMLFSLFAGLIIDRFPKKKIILITQTIAMFLAFIMAFLVFTDNIQYWHIIVLACILGLSNTVDMPTRQSFTIEIVGKKDLLNAVALNSATFNLARILGPAIGAIFMAYLGAGWCFLINGFSFMAVIYSLLHIDVESYVRKKTHNSNILQEIKDGLQYICKTPLLLRSVLMVTVVGIFVFNFNVLIPVYTKNVLLLKEDAYGFLLSSLGIGSFIGAIFASLKSKKGPQTIFMIVSPLVMAVMLVMVGIVRSYEGAALFLALCGICNIMFSTTANSTLQINSKDEYRGRVMSIYSLVFVGSAPIGSLFSGYISDRLGADKAFIINGVITLILLIIIMQAFNFSKNRFRK